MEMTAMYNTLTFKQIYPVFDDFVEDYVVSGFPDNIKRQSLQVAFYLLYGKYGNNPIANRDLNQWKTKLFGVLFQYGPTWEKRLDIQDKLRNLNETELIKGTKQINNRAYNPDTAPGTSSLEELSYINDQNTSSITKSKLDAYGMLWDLLANDVSDEFIGRFKKLFKMFVSPESVLLYGDEESIEQLNIFDELGY